MLLGKTPFRGKTPSETLMAHVHQALPLPRSLDPDVDPRVEVSLVKVLAKDPDDRYESPTELMQALAATATPSGAALDTQDTIEGRAVPEIEVGSEDGGEAERTPEAAGNDTPERISLDRSRVMAMSTASETPGDYGVSHSGVSMAYEVTAEEETEEHYVITLAFRPQGTFIGSPGQEQFFIDKQGSVAHRQVLKLPAGVSGRRFPVVPIAVGSAVVAVAVVIGLVAVFSGGGGGEELGGEGPPAAPVAPPTGPPVSEASPPASVPPSPTAPAVPGAPSPAAPTTAVVLPVPAASTAAEVRGTGTALIWDDKAANDSLTYLLTGVTPPGEGRVYMGWLATADRSLKVTTGPMMVQPYGSIDHTVDRDSPEYLGLDLVGTFSTIVITVELIGGAFDAPLGLPAFSHEVPAGAIEHIRHLLSGWPPGSDKGILTNLKEQLEIAIFHAGLAQESDSIEEVRQYTEHVINIVEGPDGANYGDLDGVTSRQVV